MSDKLQGFLYVIAAPSGAGKTSLVDHLLKSVNDLKVSISYTTREMRPGETEDTEYHFVDDKKFAEMVAADDFLEYAKVYGHSYGTSRNWVIERLEKGKDIILEIDWQGARQIRERFPNAISIFILPPSLSALKERLERRKQDSQEVIDQRMAHAKAEIEHCHEFDYLVVNDDFGIALSELRRIIRSQRLRSAVQKHKLAKLLADLLEKQ